MPMERAPLGCLPYDPPLYMITLMPKCVSPVSNVRWILLSNDGTGLSAIFVTMKVLTKSAFASAIEVNLPLSKSEGIRALISFYLHRRGRGVSQMPDRELLGADAPEDLYAMYDGLQALLSGHSDITLTASASVARFLLALAAAERRQTTFHLTDPQLLRRPMGPLLVFLQRWGVTIDRTADRWIVDSRHEVVPRETEVDARAWESSQFVSAIIYFAVAKNYSLIIRRQHSDPSSRYIALTIDCLRQIGIDLAWEADRIKFEPSCKIGFTALDSYDLTLPADYSSAAFWLELQALHPEIQMVVLKELKPNSSHPDARVFNFFDPFLDVVSTDHSVRLTRRNEPTEVELPLCFDLSQNPDLFPALFATVIGLGVPATFTGLSSLVYKESDRLGASLSIAHSLGWSADAFVRLSSDGFTYTGVPRETTPACVTLNHRGDHRLAMAFGVLATALEWTQVMVPDDVAVTARSYPHFFTDLCRQAR